MKKILSILSIILFELPVYCQEIPRKDQAVSDTNKIRWFSPGMFTSSYGDTKLSFVGAGDIQQSLSEGSEIAANTGIGVIFKKIWTKERAGMFSDFEIDFSINIASSVDSIFGVYENNTIQNTRDFGTYLLLPMNSGQATRFKADFYFNPNKVRLFPLGKKNAKDGSGSEIFSTLISGGSVEYISSNRVWVNSNESNYATGYLYKVGMFHEFIPMDIRLEKGYSLKLGIAVSYRGIVGDVGFNTDSSEAFRRSIIGTDTRRFVGWEIDLGFRLKNIEAKVSIPTLFGKDSDVPGLTGSQFITSITFIGGFPIELQSESERE